ncbi:MAG: ABC transporter ATP-binding protein [Chloroflexi bacterium]|nr:ABC transporter ATP-binding protein [Chloroflexota bacterium]
MLSVEGATVYYGRVRALREVSLKVDDGEIVTLIGANGAGKTTLLNAIAGVMPLTSGQVSLDGKPLSGLPAHEVVRIGVGYVPEGRQIFGSLSVLDNLMLGGYSRNIGSWLDLLSPLGRFARRSQVKNGLQNVHRLFPILKERSKQRAGSLSGGEQQMLAIGRALMSSPKILLLDEPSLGLAPNLTRELLHLLVRLRQEGVTILLIEQDAMAALRIANRGYVMERGRIVAEGTDGELLGNDRLMRAYLGGVVA